MPAQPLGEVGPDRLPQLSAVVPAPCAGTGEARQRHVVGGVAQFAGPEGEALLPLLGQGVVGPGPHMVRVRRRGRQHDGLAEDAGPVDREHVGQQDRERVTVVDQMVLDVDEPVLVVCEADQRPAQQRSLVGVERGLGLGAQQLDERGLGVRLTGQIHGVQTRRAGVGHLLAGHRAGHGDEFQTESGVTLEGRGESVAQGVGVQSPHRSSEAVKL